MTDKSQWPIMLGQLVPMRERAHEALRRLGALESTGTWQELQAAANRLAPRAAGVVPIVAYHATRHRQWPPALSDGDGWHHLGTPEAALGRAVHEDRHDSSMDEAYGYEGPSAHWHVHEAELHGRMYPHVLDDETANSLVEHFTTTAPGTASHPNSYDQRYLDDLGLPEHPRGYTIFPYRNESKDEDEGSISYLAHHSTIKVRQSHDLGPAYQGKSSEAHLADKTAEYQHRPAGPPRPDDYYDGGQPAHDLDFNRSGPSRYGDGTVPGSRFRTRTLQDHPDAPVVRTLRQARGNPDHPITMYRALPHEHIESGFRPGDWVTLSKSYAQSHARGNGYAVIKATVPAQHLWTDGDYNEWGYHGEPVQGQVHTLGRQAGKTAAMDATDYEGEVGNPTHITRGERGELPIDAVRHMRGARGELPGEHRNRQGQAWEDFKADIAANGVRNPIFITVDHDEAPKLSEGSHRRDAVVELGLRGIPAEVRYFGHAERQGTVEQRAGLGKQAAYQHDPLEDQECEDCGGAHATEDCDEQGSHHTDWDRIWPHISDVHRGINVELPHEVHQIVHDPARPVAERAHALLRHLQAHPHGMHWTDSPEQAEHYTTAFHGEQGTPVVISGRKPDRDWVEEDPDSLRDARVIGYDLHDDREVPLQSHAPVAIHTIAWGDHGAHELTHRHHFEQPLTVHAVRRDPHHGEGPWFHGTNADLKPGDQLKSGDQVGEKAHGQYSDGTKVWVSNDPWRAGAYGHRTYAVEPHSRPRSPYANHDEHHTTGATVLFEVDREGKPLSG